MERWMIVYLLPLEVWMDIFVFPWIKRHKFGRLVARIGNFKFAEHAQFYLHEWGKHTLDELEFDKGGLYKYVKGKRLRLKYPQTPIPENIKSFDCIRIRHFDAQTVDFLGKITPLLTGLFINVGHMPPKSLANFRTILTYLAPMLDEIPWLFCCEKSAFPAVKEQLFRKNEELTKLKMLVIGIDSETEVEQQEMVAFIVNWLAQPDTDGPRLLGCLSESGFFKEIFKAIREQFLAATSPRTFAVDLNLYNRQERQANEFHLENGIGEELHGEWDGIKDVFQITRHPANRKTKEVREWIKAMTKTRNDRTIWIYDQTIGSLVAPRVDVQPVDKKQDDQQKPCS